MTQRTLTFNDTTYNLNNTLSIEIKVPSLFFGEENERSQDHRKSEDHESEDEDDEEEE